MVKDYSKDALNKILKGLPTGYKFEGARYHLKRAIQEITKIETREEKKVIQQDQMLVPPLTATQGRSMIDKIDDLINQEQEKINQLKIKPSEEETLFN